MNRITETTALPAVQPTASTDTISRVERSFGSLLADSVNQVNEMQLRSDMAARQLHAGGAKNLHEAMIAMEEADISLRYLVQLRNKVVDAYQEIMRMQV